MEKQLLHLWCFMFKCSKIDCDYMVGAQLEGFSTMVKLSDAPVIVLEGDDICLHQ